MKRVYSPKRRHRRGEGKRRQKGCRRLAAKIKRRKRKNRKATEREKGEGEEDSKGQEIQRPDEGLIVEQAGRTGRRSIPQPHTQNLTPLRLSCLAVSLAHESLHQARLSAQTTSTTAALAAPTVPPSPSSASSIRIRQLLHPVRLGHSREIAPSRQVERLRGRYRTSR